MMIIGFGAMLLVAGVAVSADHGPAEYVPETPTMPTQPAGTWLTYHLAHPGPGGVHDPNAAFFYASSPESVGELGLRQVAELM
jgi:hypothetical protein